MCAVIKFITDTGFAPDIDLPLDFVPADICAFVPADICAAAIRYISSRAAPTGMPIIWPAPHSTLLGSLVIFPAGTRSRAGQAR
jgi:hypothetical protein